MTTCIVYPVGLIFNITLVHPQHVIPKRPAYPIEPECLSFFFFSLSRVPLRSFHTKWLQKSLIQDMEENKYCIATSNCTIAIATDIGDGYCVLIEGIIGKRLSHIVIIFITNDVNLWQETKHKTLKYNDLDNAMVFKTKMSIASKHMVEKTTIIFYT
ncbi:hypothetical protein ACJX0J_029484 [Zea mays]